ncbi:MULTISPECIES: hypothetical protein [unclassified Lentimonas]|uniref:hypothetical protein n=1 Tax=unclassified Lentimonas TaxID=2630993 RepID=UPI001324C9A4|nr:MULTISPECIES: hypothetical protein [unclassified Lentimonas]CAA6677554.1 Unannotated [Lentimonas sp. CC4]CAA6684349.1 Unannotated [Lentimonas sp. CC6]CAA7078133.1 Unannotated [Lentimonas sp. CC4]CAA7172093.1 Unannotated [Lentimonas sp. CC21]CAA7181818.1 Unannotated [Lentimonas sp. CC8]
MRGTHKSFIVVAALVVAISALWFVRSQRDTDAPKVEQYSTNPDGFRSRVSTVDLLKHRPELIEAPEAKVETTDPVNSPALTEAESVSAATEGLNDLLPAWLSEEGSLLHDRREIQGQTVLRSRGRYQWEDGSSLEIEITDVGLEANESLIKALGFDLELADVDEPDGYKSTQDEEGMLVNQEYDYADKSGSLQILMSDRYLVEIQIEQMEEEAFQEILDTQIPFDELFKRVEP